MTTRWWWPILCRVNGGDGFIHCTLSTVQSLHTAQCHVDCHCLLKVILCLFYLDLFPRS